MVAPVLSVLVLSEDSSPSAHETISALARKMLQFVDRHTASHRVRFLPTHAQRAVRANVWQSRKPHAQLVDLRRELARKVLEDDVPGYVLFHFDGDRRWSERASSTNAEKFETFVQGLRPLVEKNLRDRGLVTDDVEAAVTERLGRIFPVVPFYSIEAWLYQVTNRARELCSLGCGKHLAIIDGWESDRAALDELIRPKEQLCIGSRKNSELAAAFTSELADTLYLLEQSFHATVERLQSCPGLAAALRATWSAAPAAPEQRS